MSTTFTNRGSPCILTRFVSVYTGYNVTLATSYYATALAAANAYDITTVGWGATGEIIYNGDGSTTRQTTNYWNNSNLFAAAGQCFSRAAIIVPGTGSIAFQLQRAQALIFCPCDYNIPEFDWAEGVFQPAPAGATPSSCSDGSVAIASLPNRGTLVTLDLPSDSSTLPSWATSGNTGATWKLLNLGALCGG